MKHENKLGEFERNVLLKKEEQEFQNYLLRVSESNNLVRWSLIISGGLLAFHLTGRYSGYHPVIIQGIISVIFGLKWLEDQFKMRRKAKTRTFILNKLIGKNYEKYEVKNKLRSFIDGDSYLMSGFLTFVVLGTIPAFYFFKIANLEKITWAWIIAIVVLFLFDVYFMWMILRIIKFERKKTNKR